MFTRTIQLLGADAFTALQQTRVILFGVGGVGGWCAETLIRTGIRHLTIVDFDLIDITNLNRQIVATHDNIGQSKVQAMYTRLKQIAPKANIEYIECKYSHLTAKLFDFSKYDVVIDAIDTLDCKALLLYRASQSNAKIYSSMGAGRKINPQNIRTTEFWKVQGCPLARALRTHMRKNNMKPISPIRCVYSEEKAGENGTIAPVVGVFGITMAAMVIEDILHTQF